MKTLIALIQIPFFLHRLVFRLGTADGLVLLAVSIAVHIHTGWEYAIYGITIGAAVTFFKTLVDISTWVSASVQAQNRQADAVRDLARVIREKELINVE